MLPSSILTKVSAMGSILRRLPDQLSLGTLDTVHYMEASKKIIGNAFQDARGAIEKTDIKAMVDKITPENIPPVAEEAKNWINKNPKTAACLGISAAVVVAPVLLTAPALAVGGFGAQGVAANSIAAGVHSGIGKVAAGSAFSVLQSAGAGGAGLTMVNGVVSGGAAVVGSATGATAWLSGRSKKMEDNNDGGAGKKRDEVAKNPGKQLKSKL